MPALYHSSGKAPQKNPKRVTYVLPSDGGNLNQADIEVYFKPQFSTTGGGAAQISYGGVDKVTEATISSNSLRFNDPNLDVADTIPATTGVDYVAFALDTITKQRHGRR